jgi:2-iminobutanoate/2-iminopropanoate deaminase
VIYSNPTDLGEPLGAYSHIAVSDGGLVSIAGQVGAKRDGTVAEGDFAAQLVETFENRRLALASEGLEPSDLLQLTTYLVSADDISIFYETRTRIFAELFPDRKYPPNTLLVVKRLVQPELLVEIAALAVKPA